MGQVRRAAAAERATNPATWDPRRIVVLPLEANAPTSVIASALAVSGISTLDTPLVTVDTSPNRPLPYLLGAAVGGDLYALGRQANIPLDREAVAEYVDLKTGSGVGVIACPKAAPPLQPSMLETALTHIDRRYRGVVIDVSSSVASTFSSVALRHADHVLAVTTESEVPDWLIGPETTLASFLANGNAAVVRVSPGNRHRPRGGPGSVPTFDFAMPTDSHGRAIPPMSGEGFDFAAAGLTLTADAVELAQFVFDGGR